MNWLRKELSKGARVSYWSAGYVAGLLLAIHVIGELAEWLS